MNPQPIVNVQYFRILMIVLIHQACAILIQFVDQLSVLPYNNHHNVRESAFGMENVNNLLNARITKSMTPNFVSPNSTVDM